VALSTVPARSGASTRSANADAATARRTAGPGIRPFSAVRDFPRRADPVARIKKDLLGPGIRASRSIGSPGAAGTSAIGHSRSRQDRTAADTGDQPGIGGPAGAAADRAVTGGLRCGAR
jgi:hypothetical protein